MLWAWDPPLLQIQSLPYWPQLRAAGKGNTFRQQYLFPHTSEPCVPWSDWLIGEAFFLSGNVYTKLHLNVSLCQISVSYGSDVTHSKNRSCTAVWPYMSMFKVQQISRPLHWPVYRGLRPGLILAQPALNIMQSRLTTPKLPWCLPASKWYVKVLKSRSKCQGHTCQPLLFIGIVCFMHCAACSWIYEVLQCWEGWWFIGFYYYIMGCGVNGTCKR